jgi:hypothetical protein
MFIAEALIPIWTEPGERPEPMETGDRPVLIVVETLGASIRGQLLDLAPTKALVMPADPFLVCSHVRMTLRFRSRDVVYTLSGMTEPNESDASFYLVFDAVTRMKVVAIVESSTNGAGEAQAAAAKRKRSKEEQRIVRQVAPPEGAERRAHARHRLQANASMTVLATGIVLKCHVLEVSFGGCRLFSESPIVLEENELVEVEFAGRGYPLRLAAKTKLKPDQNVVGLEFVNSSARTRVRLQELIAELEAEQEGNLAAATGHAERKGT